MECNKEQAESALHRAKEYHRLRDLGRAEKYARTSLRLYPTAEAQELIEKCERGEHYTAPLPRQTSTQGQTSSSQTQPQAARPAAPQESPTPVQQLQALWVQFCNLLYWCLDQVGVLPQHQRLGMWLILAIPIGIVYRYVLHLPGIASLSVYQSGNFVAFTPILPWLIMVVISRLFSG
eukprot:TRINITY_DN84347_c0_g1_i1.p1 TRINITY_DN84347_c0_g1~~TRINITY_DN84347_c0_g1_i1.p1  ORF type:complete len:178 (+),score=3.08 TRINITY_DN84347_c0_g1_i1:40-573(+)